MEQRNFTIVDVETTGGSPAFHRIIEIGVLRIEKGELAATFKSFVNPGRPIPEFITQVTGITDRQVEKAPVFDELAEELLPLFEDSLFVAHNSSFDYTFLQSEFERAGFAFHMESLCTVRLSRVLYPKYKKHNLSALIDRFNFICKRRHRALDDARVLWDFLQLINQEFSREELATALGRTIKKIPPKQQRSLPPVAEPEVTYVAEEF